MSAVPLLDPTRGSRGRAPQAESQPAHVEIVSSRNQRRARPRLGAALITVGGLFLILAAQLLLSIATSEGAYAISSLQTEQAELARDEQVLTENLQVLEAPQHLATEAQGLGMVANTSAAYLRLADGTVLGAPTRAAASSAFLTAADGTPLIPDSLLAGVPLVSDQEATAAAAAAAGGALTLNADGSVTGGAPMVVGTDAGAPDTVPTGGSIASTAPAGIPSPVTH